ncbi:GNAT family N-acetyltransferase [Tropicimonas marinistellae]|uniref:GNAT family N-acetyltransferase n=1 Tax=Tropicimonas marinistellae TaxID=1739787 RepID=UPI0008370219|nr:GNAT family N-acetyltransferase [Tropicimonas marinistellae]
MDAEEKPAELKAVSIRRAVRGDIPCLVDMVSALAAYHGDLATVSPQSLERDIFGPGACARALLAERDGAAVGYVALACYPALHFGRRVMEMHHLYVAPAQRGRGVGRHLVAAAVEEARRENCGRITVSTDPDNARAQEIYGSMGFAPQSPGGPRFRLELPETGALPAGWV